MPGFFELIENKKTDGTLLAAWITAGKNAGVKALFDRGSLLFRDASFPAELAAQIRETTPGQEGIRDYGDVRVFLERIAGRKKLVICGAGHVALALIRISISLGYHVTVIEDREAFATKARDAGAHHVVCRPFAEALDSIPGDPSTAFVIMTREHAHDVECLRRILPKTYVYAGMMGSRSRSESIRQQLIGEGADAGRVAEVHMPIGLPIGSRTPEEIAVSVVAELIQVMNAADPGEGWPEGMTAELATLDETDTVKGILAMIIEKNGEAPRRPGTRMWVRRDGSFLGTVGGGYAEAVILETAGKMMRENCRESRTVRVSMKKGTMYCGGDISVLMMPF